MLTTRTTILPVSLVAALLVALASFACDDGGGGGDAGTGDPSCDDGVLDGVETDVDCGGDCGPCSTGLACDSGRDCRSRVCAYGVCSAPSCDDGILNGDEPTTDCGGACPDRCPGGAACGLHSDCESYRCDSGVCVSATCTDAEKNGDETDVDCGGGECPGCGAGLVCGVAGDCESLRCEAGLCLGRACDDLVRNGDETDVDCGGSCAPCADGLGCAAAADCASAVCTFDICQPPTCTDSVANGGEGDADCGGPCEQCELGRSCNTGADCTTSFCGEGVCDHGDSCFALAASAGPLADGVYLVRPEPGADLTEVLCDMTTDGGGWTLVVSTLDATVDDEAAAWYPDLLTLYPSAAHAGVWDGMRAALDGHSDIRFSCKGAPTAEAMRVDLSFYWTPWYQEITSGTDAESCFSEGEGAGYERPAPARRDIVAERFLRRGDDWARGYLEGEDACDDEGDFAVDFDDRGVAGDGDDGTDWGEADESQRCGFSNLTIGAWFVWVRRTAPHCVDGASGDEETGVDCGGVCPPCPDGQGCSVGGECSSSVCIGSICQRASCRDGVRNGDETDVDCGGSCDPCGPGGRCEAPSDCTTAACVGGICQEE
jgi:hypothetical protein